MNFTSRLNDYVALRIAAMNAYDRADRLESLAAHLDTKGSRHLGRPAWPPDNGTGLIPRTHDRRPTRSIATATSRPTLTSISRPAPPPNSLLVGSELRDNPLGHHLLRRLLVRLGSVQPDGAGRDP